LDNDAPTVMRLISETIASVAPPPGKPWNKRILLGCWAVKYLPLCALHLPTFPITHIGFSLPYARRFLAVPNVSFNILQKSLMTPLLGRRFLRDAKAQGRPVYDWTVNEVSMMKWSILHGLDGVITDDPKRYLEVCDEWEAGRGKRDLHISFNERFAVLWVNFMVLSFTLVFWWKYASSSSSSSSSSSDGNARKSAQSGRIEQAVPSPVVASKGKRERGGSVTISDS
ncbi:MAG: hypothetical protein Q9163_002536, partial [Psora crenata]